MEKVYKIAPYRVVLNIIYGIAAGGAGGVLVGRFTNRVDYAGIAAAVVVLLYWWIVIRDNRLSITVTPTHIIIKKSGKETFFELAKVGFRAYTTTTSGDTACSLYIDDEEGKSHYIDCELLGEGQFLELIEDLKITGDQAPVSKIQTK